MDDYSSFVRYAVCKTPYCVLCKVIAPYPVSNVCAARTNTDFIITRSGGNVGFKNVTCIIHIQFKSIFLNKLLLVLCLK